jgi:hypothetical protein
MNMSNREKVEDLLTNFREEIKNKWHSTYSRNLSNDCFAESGLFAKLQIFDPFKKCLENQSFEYYSLIS